MASAPLSPRLPWWAPPLPQSPRPPRRAPPTSARPTRSPPRTLAPKPFSKARCGPRIGAPLALCVFEALLRRWSGTVKFGRFLRISSGLLGIDLLAHLSAARSRAGEAKFRSSDLWVNTRAAAPLRSLPRWSGTVACDSQRSSTGLRARLSRRPWRRRAANGKSGSAMRRRPSTERRRSAGDSRSRAGRRSLRGQFVSGQLSQAGHCAAPARSGA